MFEWIQAIRQARYRLAQAISIPSSPKPEDLKVCRATLASLTFAWQSEEVLETLRKSNTLLHRKHSIEKKAYRDCFLGIVLLSAAHLHSRSHTRQGVELTDAIMVHWKLGKREEACQVAQKVFATGQVVSLNGPAEFVDGRFCYQLKKP